jgi:hypothetical protein
MAVTLRLALVMGPLAWVIDQGLGYPMVKPSCADGSDWPLLAISVVCLAISALGGGLGWGALARLRGAREDGGARVDRNHFLAVIAIGFNVLAALLIVAAAIPMAFLSPCE